NNAGWDEDAIRFGATYVGSSAATATKVGIPPLPDEKAPGLNDTIPNYAAGATKWYPNFGSAHSSGMNAGMADGGVRFISYNIDLETMRRLSLSADRLPISGQ